jgi:hypothetical protein
MDSLSSYPGFCQPEGDVPEARSSEPGIGDN